MRYTVIFVSFLVVLMASCRKDEKPLGPGTISYTDFRDAKTGTYEMEVSVYHWQMGTTPYWTEDTILASVTKYDSLHPQDCYLNTGPVYDDAGETVYGMTIQVNSYCYTNCYLRLDDTIRPLADYHYYHTGYFTGDSLYFNLSGLGGLGGGTNYKLRGRKL